MKSGVALCLAGAGVLLALAGCGRGFMSGELYRHGLICRADDRGDPVIQLSPPLIADTEEFELIDRVLRQVLTEAWERIVRH